VSIFGVTTEVLENLKDFFSGEMHTARYRRIVDKMIYFPPGNADQTNTIYLSTLVSLSVSWIHLCTNSRCRVIAELEWAMMMGRTVVAIVKKFWILAVVLTLALSLTSCSSSNTGYGSGYASLSCSGPKDSFEVELDPNPDGSYTLVLTPTSLSTEGVIAEIALMGDSAQQLNIVDPYITLNTGLPVNIPLTLNDVMNYSNVAVAHYDINNPGTPFVDLPAGAVCTIPVPGNGAQANGTGSY
jgi:hypothetical protein